MVSKNFILISNEKCSLKHCAFLKNLNLLIIPDGHAEDWRAMLDVNVLAVLICTQQFLRSMKQRGNQTGHIIIMDR